MKQEIWTREFRNSLSEKPDLHCCVCTFQCLTNLVRVLLALIGLHAFDTPAKPAVLRFSESWDSYFTSEIRTEHQFHKHLQGANQIFQQAYNGPSPRDGFEKRIWACTPNCSECTLRTKRKHVLESRVHCELTRWFLQRFLVLLFLCPLFWFVVWCSFRHSNFDFLIVRSVFVFLSPFCVDAIDLAVNFTRHAKKVKKTCVTKIKFSPEWQQWMNWTTKIQHYWSSKV